MYFSIFNFLIIGLRNSLANFSFFTISFLTAPSTVFLLYIFKYLMIYKYFRISGQSLIKENCHNSRTSDNIDLKLRQVTRIGKRNTTTSKKIDKDFMPANCDVIVICPNYGKFGAIQKPDSGRIVCITYVFINSNLLSYKN